MRGLISLVPHDEDEVLKKKWEKSNSEGNFFSHHRPKKEKKSESPDIAVNLPYKSDKDGGEILVLFFEDDADR